MSVEPSSTMTISRQEYVWSEGRFEQLPGKAGAVEGRDSDRNQQ